MRKNEYVIKVLAFTVQILFDTEIVQFRNETLQKISGCTGIKNRCTFLIYSAPSEYTPHHVTTHFSECTG